MGLCGLRSVTLAPSQWHPPKHSTLIMWHWCTRKTHLPAPTTVYLWQATRAEQGLLPFGVLQYKYLSYVYCWAFPSPFAQHYLIISKFCPNLLGLFFGDIWVNRSWNTVELWRLHCAWQKRKKLHASNYFLSIFALSAKYSVRWGNDGSMDCMRWAVVGCVRCDSGIPRHEATGTLLTRQVGRLASVDSGFRV